FHEKILENKELDYDLLLYFSYRLLIKHPKILSHLSNIFKYILVDEYQDTQDLQYGIIGTIIKESKGKCKVFLVGDPDQAIFESLGGIAKTLEEIKEDIGGEDIILKKLSGNYRS